MKTITSISFKEWLQLWQTLGLTILKIVLGLVIILFRGLVKTTVHAYKGLIKWIGAHPTGALAAFAFCIVIVALLSKPQPQRCYAAHPGLTIDYTINA